MATGPDPACAKYYTVQVTSAYSGHPYIIIDSVVRDATVTVKGSNYPPRIPLS